MRKTNDSAGNAATCVSCGQATSIAHQAQIVLKLVKHNGSANDAQRSVQRGQIVLKSGHNLSVIVADHIAVVTDVSHFGVDVAVSFVQRIEVAACRAASSRHQTRAASESRLVHVQTVS